MAECGGAYKTAISTAEINEVFQEIANYEPGSF